MEEEGVKVDIGGATIADEFDLAQASRFINAARIHERVEDGVKDCEGFASGAFDVADDESVDLAHG